METLKSASYLPFLFPLSFCISKISSVSAVVFCTLQGPRASFYIQTHKHITSRHREKQNNDDNINN